ncbi:MAG: radical SAM protein [Oscillospiraceae bacterium]|jgi:threonylcarbamoyladenosine tRNA methylthiotransferase MtaB|nr:radical SAM protein [Oscillospiraceae bacterium]
MIKLFTFGCKTNLAEVSAVADDISKIGFSCKTHNGNEIFSRKNILENTRFAIINTCTVTENADDKTRKAVRTLRKYLGNLPNADGKIEIILVGCMVRADPEKAMSVGADRVFASLSEAFDYIIRGSPPTADHNNILFVKSHTRDFLKIEDGCNNYCAYCLIPKARGGLLPTSMRVDEAEYRVRELYAQSQFKQELVLTGINLSLYEYGLSAVVRAAVSVGYTRIRLGSLEPNGKITESELESLSQIPELCPHFHISLQSGSARILSAMRRRYTPQEYMRFITLVRRHFPNANITTDIIAGFDGETDEDFADTLEFAEECGFSKIHAFAYSERAGTIAEQTRKLAIADVRNTETVNRKTVQVNKNTESVNCNPVPENTKKQRADALRALSVRLQKKYTARFLGQRLQVLCEKDGTGYSREYIRVRLPDGCRRGEVYEVTLTEDNLL